MGKRCPHDYCPDQGCLNGCEYPNLFVTPQDDKLLSSASLAAAMKAVTGLPRTGDVEIDTLLEKCLETLKKKGADYTQGSPDRLHNFRTVGQFLGLPMERVWSVYFYKHLSAIFRFCKEGQVESEPIEGRIMDCIVYLLLFAKIVAESARSNEPVLGSPAKEPVRCR